MIAPWIFEHPFVGWYLLAIVLAALATIYGAKYAFRVLSIYYEWPEWDIRSWSHGHPGIVLAAVLLLVKLTIFAGLGWAFIHILNS